MLTGVKITYLEFCTTQTCTEESNVWFYAQMIPPSLHRSVMVEGTWLPKHASSLF